METTETEQTLEAEVQGLRTELEDCSGYLKLASLFFYLLLLTPACKKYSGIFVT